MTDTWTVTGSQAVRGHKPGETFEEAIPEAQANRLQRSGALRKEAGKPAKGKGAGKSPAPENTESADAGEASDASGDTKKEE